MNGKVKLKKYYYILLQKVFKFASWHLNSIEIRPYAKWIVDRINKMIQVGTINSGIIMEIGCGLGDIIANIKYNEKEGYDIEENVIKASKWAHPGIKTKKGTFTDIKGKKIGILITVDFLFNIDEEQIIKYFSDIVESNYIDRILLDEVPSPPYKYGHDYLKIMMELGYKLEYKSRGFSVSGGYRKILIFRKRME